MTALAFCGFLMTEPPYTAAAAFRDSNFRGARLVDPALEAGPSDFGVNFLGFLFSPFVEAGGLFSLLTGEAAGFDWLGAAGLFAACGLEASFGGDFFDSVSFFVADSFGLEDGAFGCGSCFAGED